MKPPPVPPPMQQVNQIRLRKTSDTDLKPVQCNGSDADRGHKHVRSLKHGNEFAHEAPQPPASVEKFIHVEWLSEHAQREV